MLGFLNVYPFLYSYVADHFQYLASLGIIVPVAAGAALLRARLSQTARPIGAGLCLLVLGTLAVLTRHQPALYTDPVTLYQATIERNPSFSFAYNNLGQIFAEGGSPASAIAHFRAAIRFNPSNAAAHSNLSVALLAQRQLPEAIEQGRAAVLLNQNLKRLAIFPTRSDESANSMKPANTPSAPCNFAPTEPRITTT